jgi:hypothetical protein
MKKIKEYQGLKARLECNREKEASMTINFKNSETLSRNKNLLIHGFGAEINKRHRNLFNEMITEISLNLGKDMTSMHRRH